MKRFVGSTCAAFLVSLFATLWAVPARGQFEELASKIPSSANAIVLLDAQRMFSSPQGVREKWKDKYDQAFAAGLVSLAPDTQRLILASQIDYEFMKPQWEVAIADFSKTRSAPEVARTTKGLLDSVGGLPVVELRDDAYVVELGEKRFAALSPANRQSVARWLRETQSRTSPELSPYLKGTLAASQQSPMVVAFDLEEAIPPDVIRAKVASSPAIKAKNVDVEAATKAMLGIRGLVLEVAVTDGSFGRLRVHFRDDASVLEPVAKAMLQEILGDLGALIDDFDSWKVQVEPQRISFNGQLSAAGRKRILSLVHNPMEALILADDAASAKPTPSPGDEKPSKGANPTVAASQQYFKAIDSIIGEIRTETRKAQTFAQNALFFDRWARRIEKLPVLNVDPDVLAFGRSVSEQLRNMSSAVRGTGIRTEARQAQVGGGYYSSDGYSYYSGWRDVQGNRQAIRAEEKAGGAMTCREIARQIESAAAKIRQDMTLKYQVEF